MSLGSFSNGNAKENIIWKKKHFPSCDNFTFYHYPILFEFYNVGEVLYNWTARKGISE